MPKRPRENPIDKAVYKSDQPKLDSLITESDALIDQLLENPSDQQLLTRLREIDIKIAALTQQKVITYNSLD